MLSRKDAELGGEDKVTDKCLPLCLLLGVWWHLQLPQKLGFDHGQRQGVTWAMAAQRLTRLQKVGP